MKALTEEQINFIQENTHHFDLVINHAQNFQMSHDIASQVIKIAEQVTGAKVDNCTGCITEAYVKVWNAFNKTKPKANDAKK